MSAAYRLRQGLRALLAWSRPVDDAQAAAVLAPPLFELFRRMRRSDRQHSLRVMLALRAAGHDDPDLLAAALLHDVGKTRTGFTLLEKVVVVLARALLPRQFQRWGSGSACSWRRPFAVSVQHPAWGAEMVAAAGGAPRTVELIRRHAVPIAAPHEGTLDCQLAALQAVDDLN